MKQKKSYYLALLLGSAICLATSAAAQTSNILWGINSAQQIYHLGAGGWNLVAPPNNGTPKQLSVSPNGIVWLLDQSGNVYTLHTASWMQMPGNLSQISAGSTSLSLGSNNNIWALDGSGNVNQWNGSSWSMVTTSVGNPLKQVSAAADGTVWALDTASNLYSYSSGTWQSIQGAPANLAQFSVGTATNAWGVNSANAIYQWNGTAWNQVASPANSTPKQVSVGPDGTAYLLDSSGNLYVWSAMAWQTIQGQTNLAQIAAGLGDCFTYKDPTVSTNGNWTPQTNASASAGGYLQDNNAGDTITFKFTGTSVALYRLMDPNGGQATVTIDGKNIGIWDFYFPQQQWRVPAVIDKLSPGQHQLGLTVSSQRDQASAGNNIYVDTFGAPAPFVPNSAELAAIGRVNFFRNPLGSATPPLPAASLSAALDLAALAHLSYLSTNYTSGGDVHAEDPTKPGYLGASPTQRQIVFGYPTSAPVPEDVSFGGTSPIDLLVSLVYHRLPFLTYSYTDIGYGQGQVTQYLTGVVEFGQPAGIGPASRIVNTYPANGQTNVPLIFPGNESPNPWQIINPQLPPNTTAGYPISVHITQPSNLQTGTSTVSATYNLTDANGNKIPFYTLDATNDPNMKSLSPDSFYILPKQTLSPATTYNAQVTGTDSQANSFNVAWSFTTVPNATISGIYSNPWNAVTLGVGWSTAGGVTMTQVQYGPTTAYGTNVADTNPGNTSHYVNLALPANTGLIHYQITATDASGNTSATPDMTFTYAPFQNSLIANVNNNLTLPYSISWSTAGPVVSTQAQYGPTTAYGTTVADNNPGTTFHSIQIPGPPGATYHYQITATDATGNTNTTPDMTITFPQVPNATIGPSYPWGITATSAGIQWSTAGPVTANQLVYGTTNAYGTTAPAPAPNNPQSPYQVTTIINGLTPNTTYHYQIVTTDAQNNTMMSPDATFTTLAQ